MALRLRARISARIERWATRRLKRRGGSVILTRKNGLYILPSRYGYLCGMLLFAMLMVAMNYNNSMVFLLSFTLGAMVFISMTHVHRNLLELELHAGSCQDVFVGDTAWFSIRVENQTRRPRYAVWLGWRVGTGDSLAVAPGNAVDLQLPLAAEKRGPLQAPRITSFTSFPFGLFRAWSWVHLAMDCVVYPQPADGSMPLPEGMAGGRQVRRHIGEDEFAGLREYQPGDSPKRIAWKVAARGQGLATKQFESGGETEVVLDFDALGGLDAETRLSRLCRWVLDCEAAGQRYALSLPGHSIASGVGPAQQRECLRALALWEGRG